ncbi:MAG: hypothetical protein AAF578_05075 [Pseudomonadota bacterium]
MINCNCIVQANQFSADTEMALRDKLTAFAEHAFGEPADITWRVIPKNSGFTAARPSVSSIILVSANRPLPQSERAMLLEQMCTLWASETQQSLNEVVGVISDPQA